MNIFVYGTLRLDQSAFGLMRGRVNFLRSTRVPFMKLLNLGAFPGMINDPARESTVLGDLFEINDGEAVKLLEDLDFYEGVPDLYTREIVKTLCGAQTYAYVLNRKPVQFKAIQSGDWLDRSEAV